MSVHPAASGREAVELLRDMVSIRSESYHEAKLARYLVKALENRGFTATVDRVGNVVGELDRGSGPTVLLLGHMDTSTGGPEARLTDDRLYGRGTVDAKGPLAALLCAAAATRTFNGRLRLVAAVEEETPYSRGAAEIVRGTEPPDAVIVGEPSGTESVVLGYKGRLDLQYDVRCAATHPTNPRPHATDRAVHAWQTLLDLLGPTSHRSFDRPGATLTEMGGDLENASARFSVRTPLGFDGSACTEELRRRLPQGEVTFVHSVPACRVRRTDPVVRSLTRAIRRQGLTPRAKVKTATSDMNTVAEHWNVPMATYGPGDSTLDHTADEHVMLCDYLQSIMVLTDALDGLSQLLKGHR